MKLKGVNDQLTKLLGKAVVVAVVAAMLISLMPAFSLPAGAWFIPEPRHVDGNWNLESGGSHIRQTIDSYVAVKHALGLDDPIYAALRPHLHELIRGSIWSDDYSYEWALENPGERVQTWNELQEAAQDATGDLPDWLIWIIDKIPVELWDGPAIVPDSVPGIGGMAVGIKHPDYSIYHLYQPDEWLDDVLRDGVHPQFRKSLGWNEGNNAVARAEFWYEMAVKAYQLHGGEEFEDPYSVDVPLDTAYEHSSLYITSSGSLGGVRLITAYDYLGRALHYLQDMTCPAHSGNFYRHILVLWYYEIWARNSYPDSCVTLPSWPEDATGGYFAERARQEIEIYMELWESLGGGVFVGDGGGGELSDIYKEIAPWLQAEDIFLAESTPDFLYWSVYLGGGMLARFHEQVGVPDLPPPEHDLIINVIGEGFTVPPTGTEGYEDGAEVSVMAVPAEGWQFAGWTGDITSPDSTAIVVMTSNKEITAVFERVLGKFSIGDVVRTTDPLNVRDEPGLSTNVLRTQPGDTAGVVLSTEDPYPRFMDGYTWWLVEYDDDTVGWSADHRLEGYARPERKFSAGDDIVTTDELYVRSEPKLSDEHGLYFTGNVVTTQPPGTKGVILDFEEPKPRRVMGYDLWEIEWEDGTVGWSSDHGLDHPVPADIDLSLVSLYAQNFPFIYLTVRVSGDGQPISYLTKDNFSVTEDGRLQTDMFDVVPPEEGGGVRMADVVFLVDTSGSMGGEIAAVRVNCVAFANALAGSDINYRLGLVRFGNSGGANPGIIGGGLTDDAETFKSWVGTLGASGGHEPGLAAIRLAIQTYSFRPVSQKVFILITDEDSDDRDKQTTIDMILANDVTVHVAANCGYGTSQADYCGSGSVRDISGGLLFAVTGDYRSILDTIGEAVANTYIVRYRTDNPVLDGVERTVVCTVRDRTATDSVQCTYIPGGAPHIQRTQETLALHEQSLVASSSPTISVEVTDAAAPFVQSVFLYVRTSGSGTGYVQISMLPQGNDIYSAAVPGGYVNPPGLDYYVRATDGEVTSSDPTTDPDMHPYKLAVLPNELPAIVHTPPTSWTTGNDVSLDVSASDSTYGITDLNVYFRRQGDLLWQSVSKSYDPPDTAISENVLLPVAAWNTEVIQYYIKVTDDLGMYKLCPEGGADDPFELVGTNDIIVSGTWKYRNETGTDEIGIRFAKVELHEMDGSYDWLLATSYTDSKGRFEFPPIENDDGLLGRDGLDIYLKIFAENSTIGNVGNGEQHHPFEHSYWERYPDPGTIDNMASGEHAFNLVVEDFGRGKWNIYDAIVEGHQYSLREVAYDPPCINVSWPRSSTGYIWVVLDHMFVESGDEWDEDVLLHEYGEFIMDKTYLMGPWKGWKRDHPWDTHIHPGLAWSEGWADFFQSAVQDDPEYCNPGVAYHDLESPNIVDLNDDPKGGRDVRGAVAGILWDIIDSTNEDGDSLDMDFSDIWDVFLKKPSNIEDFWTKWFEAGKNHRNELTAIYVLHGVRGPAVKEIKKDLRALKESVSDLSLPKQHEDIKDVLKEYVDTAIDEVDKAIDRIDEGKKALADQSLQDARSSLVGFIAQVEAYRDAGNIPSGEANALISQAQAIINSIDSLM